MANYNRKFTCTTDGSNKFWEIEVDNKTVTTSWGRIGTKGQSSKEEYSTNSGADLFAYKKIREKLKKGYTEKEDVAEPGFFAPIPTKVKKPRRAKPKKPSQPASSEASQKNDKGSSFIQPKRRIVL